MRLLSPRIRQRLFRVRPEDRLPHLVSHQRVYIVPTGRGWAFLLALLLMLVASVNYALSLGYALCFLLTGLFAATLLHTYRNLAGLQVSRISGGECFAGESLPFDITLTNNRSQVRHGLRLATTEACVSGIRLEPARDTRMVLPLPTTRRGVLPLGRLTLQSDWPLGLWTCWSYLHVQTQGLVFPRPETNPPALPLSAGDDGDTNPRPGLQGDVSGLRHYQPGDSIGSIAWKSAARGQGLLVRSFDSDEGLGKTALSLHSTGLHALEQQLSRLCAWVLLAESRQTPYALQLSTRQLPAAQGSEQRVRALQALALHDSATTGQPT
ncbi:DUF58 domain-containing protein [Granulosicoccus sp. 3-233]|uniref:DUF58 domain-containing protein n=1 Tax=Granulosicoccus sp. 3-233 TaxID=3417969 RepID=UPI003D355B9E